MTGANAGWEKTTVSEDVTITSVVNQLVFDPASDNHLFAATSMGVFESSDGGDTWKKRMEGLKDILMVVTVAIDPLSPQVMYAGTSGGVYKSVDMGRHWEKANGGSFLPTCCLPRARLW